MDGLKKYFLILFFPIFAFLTSTESLYSMKCTINASSSSSSAQSSKNTDADETYYDCIDNIAEIENSKSYAVISFVCIPFKLLGKALQKIEEKLDPKISSLNRKIANSKIVTKFCNWIIRKSTELVRAYPLSIKQTPPCVFDEKEVEHLGYSKGFSIFWIACLLTPHFSQPILIIFSNHPPVSKTDFHTCSELENGQQYCCHLGNNYEAECCLFNSTQNKKDPNMCVTFNAATGDPNYGIKCQRKHTGEMLCYKNPMHTTEKTILDQCRSNDYSVALAPEAAKLQSSSNFTKECTTTTHPFISLILSLGKFFQNYILGMGVDITNIKEHKHCLPELDKLLSTVLKHFINLNDSNFPKILLADGTSPIAFYHPLFKIVVLTTGINSEIIQSLKKMNQDFVEYENTRLMELKSFCKQYRGNPPTQEQIADEYDTNHNAWLDKSSLIFNLKCVGGCNIVENQKYYNATIFTDEQILSNQFQSANKLKYTGGHEIGHHLQNLGFIHTDNNMEVEASILGTFASESPCLGGGIERGLPEISKDNFMALKMTCGASHPSSYGIYSEESAINNAYHKYAAGKEILLERAKTQAEKQKASSSSSSSTIAEID